MIKTSFETNNDKVFGNTLDFCGEIDRVRPCIVDIVKMLDFLNVRTVKVIIQKRVIFAKKSSVIVTLKSFEDVIDFCQNNEDLIVTYARKEDNEMLIFTEI